MTIQYSSFIILLSLSATLAANETVQIEGHEFVLVDHSADFLGPVLNGIAESLRSEEATLRNYGIDIGKEYLAKQLAEIDFQELLNDSIDYAVEQVVEHRHKGNDGYFCHYVTKPAQKRAGKLALQAAWGTTESAYQYSKEAAKSLAKPGQMRALQEKVIAAYSSADRGQARAQIVEALKTHIADVVVGDRYANDASTMAEWVYAPAEKMALKAIVGRILGKMSFGVIG